MGGYTLIPEMAKETLSASQLKRVREFSRPVPTREVSLVHSRLFHKERFIEALERVIVNSLPSGYHSPKKKVIEVVGIL